MKKMARMKNAQNFREQTRKSKSLSFSRAWGQEFTDWPVVGCILEIAPN